MRRVVVWGTGNMGSTAIRSAVAFPGLELAGVLTSSAEKAGRDAAEFAGLPDPTGIRAGTDVDAALAAADAVAYMASGDIRPEEAIADIERCLRAGKHVVTPSLYSLYDPASAPVEWVQRLTSAAEEGGATLLVSGVDPGWGNDALAVTAASLCTRIDTITCQEIFDYSTYNQPEAVRLRCGFGGAMDDTPMMLLPSIPTMVWGGNVRLIGRGLGIEIDDITEEVERLPLEQTVDTVMGPFEKGTQGAFFLKVIGWSQGRKRVIIEHITRIHPSCAPEWPQPDEGVGDHRVIVDGDPQLTITTRADVPGGTRADGGNTTAANRLLGALNWLAEQKPGIYDGLQVPLRSAVAPEAEAARWT
ncbi:MULTISPECIES: NAD(P)H-dependent amine dehydrogenase family protein [Mycobacteriaceae]|uniref:Dihydrodipicolinate reductase n=1 Tax=Mycolicibacterium neoaurum VKM Ac-1815D TaxID=700508 RepID=V5X8A6_MYCNE|nr:MULTISPECIES: dihydrodipicolinate reductase [Mycobacteriaceae]AHC23629.1 dihydrodipicolinate reductase [Mycolicibacterium neoaurum VKM Ac-1815D]AMO04316.1 dihydrodipicolinate reductase [Mycolicibacterium neoaurum]AXK77401.1 dihydrodipicolinate reductase [Mycolicibacterium neoaurum]KJQ48942.1 dihydrodipicolinate reductase [Mycolicibacterium neoaurum]KUM07498.1 dihydrodipicolinate reductase [Mycolicibacterium neoaurum]